MHMYMVLCKYLPACSFVTKEQKSTKLEKDKLLKHYYWTIDLEISKLSPLTKIQFLLVTVVYYFKDFHDSEGTALLLMKDIKCPVIAACFRSDIIDSC
jgi:hypothetical protein